MVLKKKIYIIISIILCLFAASVLSSCGENIELTSDEQIIYNRVINVSGNKKWYYIVKFGSFHKDKVAMTIKLSIYRIDEYTKGTWYMVDWSANPENIYFAYLVALSDQDDNLHLIDTSVNIDNINKMLQKYYNEKGYSR